MKEILLHFDVQDHFILLRSFSESARAAERAVLAFNQEIFSSTISIELVVLAPREGSLREYIGVIAKIGKTTKGVLVAGALTVIAVLEILDSPTFQQVYRELVGEAPADTIIRRVRKIRDIAADDLADPVEVESQTRAIVEEILVSTTTQALQIEPTELEQTHLPHQLRNELRNAQAELYSGLLLDTQIDGIGFTEEPFFPIRRSQFPERAVRPQPLEETEEEPDWEVSEAVFRVTSPNFDKEDQSSRKWKAKSSSGSFFLFEMHDEEFWRAVVNHDIEFGDSTELHAQIATRSGKGRSKEKNVVRVLKVNGEKFANRLDEESLAAILGRFRKVAHDERQGSLF